MAMNKTSAGLSVLSSIGLFLTRVLLRQLATRELYGQISRYSWCILIGLDFLVLGNKTYNIQYKFTHFPIPSTVEPVYIEHSREMKKCSMYAGVQCIQVPSNWRLGEIETKLRLIRETW